ncbi:MAG: DNA polymerase III subunit beta, partial [Muribaculum sp.]|nr:DNA polymerase III subunit beta [Muribaculum sp.]
MKFNVSSKSLYGFTSAVSKVIGTKNAMSVLDNFLFELSGNTLIITASDVENVLTAKMEVMDAEGEGKFCLNARRIVELLKEMPDQGITFTINDNNLSVDITYASGNSTLIALNGNEYPTNELSQEAEDGGTLEFTCPSELIMKGLENTLFAVGTAEIRTQMMGILGDIKQDGIVFVAP